MSRLVDTGNPITRFEGPPTPIWLARRSGAPPSSRRRPASLGLLELDDLGFQEEILSKPGIALVGFGVGGLRSTLELRGLLQALAITFASRVVVAQVDADRSAALANLYRIDVMPTVILLRDGAELGRLQGLRQLLHYEIAVETALAAAPSAPGAALHESN